MHEHDERHLALLEIGKPQAVGLHVFQDGFAAGSVGRRQCGASGIHRHSPCFPVFKPRVKAVGIDATCGFVPDRSGLIIALLI
jgi:hypothetical protein